MPIDVKTPDSPGWWLARLHEKLRRRRRARLDDLFARYQHDMVMPPELRDAPDAAQRFYRLARTNYAEVIVRSSRYRLAVTRITTPSSIGEAGDSAAWQLWRSSGMEVASDDVHRMAGVAGDSYVILGAKDSMPRATAEDPRQVVTIHDPADQAVVRAAAKFYRDSDVGVDYAYLYRPGRVWRARAKASTSAAASMQAPTFGPSWDWDPTFAPEGEDPAMGRPLPAGFEDVVPVIRYRCEEGVGDFERHRPLLDRIDHLILQGMVTVTFQAFKQRGIKVQNADDLPDKDPDTGEEIDYQKVYAADPGSLWRLPSAAEMWESGAVDVTPIGGWVRKEEERLAAVTFTPLHMFAPDGANQSAHGSDMIRDAGVDKTEDKQRRFGQAHAQVMSLLMRMAGGFASDDTDPWKLRIGWAPAARYGLTEKTAAAAAAKTAGVPFEAIMTEILQYPPEMLAKLKSQRMADALLFPATVGAGTSRQNAQSPGDGAAGDGAAGAPA